MNNLKTNPVGIDLKIDKLQKKIYSYFDGFNVEGYPRVYDIENKDKVIPAHFVSGNDYKDVLLDDKQDAIFFFKSDGSDNLRGSMMSSDVEIFFMLNLKKLKPSSVHRPDEEIKLELLDVIQRKLNREQIDIVKGDEVLRGYQTNIRNMNPYYLLKYSFEINYTL